VTLNCKCQDIGTPLDKNSDTEIQIGYVKNEKTVCFTRKTVTNAEPPGEAHVMSLTENQQRNIEQQLVDDQEIMQLMGNEADNQKYNSSNGKRNEAARVEPRRSRYI
jgi:hypothetical protein